MVRPLGGWEMAEDDASKGKTREELKAMSMGLCGEEGGSWEESD